MSTVIIVPAFSDQAGQCRIYAHAQNVRNALRAYREDNGRGWREVGIMRSDGRISCIEPEFADLRADEPLMAGTAFTF